MPKKVLVITALMLNVDQCNRKFHRGAAYTINPKTEISFQFKQEDYREAQSIPAMCFSYVVLVVLLSLLCTIVID